MCRNSQLPCLNITTLVGVWRICNPLAGRNMLGMPLGTQDERAWNAIFPFRISSLSFFITCFTQSFRTGLERSPSRQLAPWLMKGCFGSCTTGDGKPGIDGNVAPPSCSHPTAPAEKSGGEDDCALAPAINASETNALPASKSFDKPNPDIVPSHLVVVTITLQPTV